ncbi:MAG: DNA polymerase IV [Alphaproteobacteria bacterium]|nr:DNA polymerase IV [Alphaproteobacteria bacterium]MCB9690686.1 DNA polymerase IV [Alphaproteobacteria bacterium]
MDAFFAAVEQRDDPSLRGKPVVVGGTPDGRGVVCTASYEARKYGVRSAMSAAHAKRLCPHAIFVPGSFSRYREASAGMHAIFHDYTDLVEGVSLDEAYLDVTENKAGLAYAREVAVDIRRRIRAELGLTASAGVAPAKFVAKIASDHRKPDGLTVIPPDGVLNFLHPLPVRKLPGVGPSTAVRLQTLGLHTVGDLYRCDERDLVRRLGSRGAWLAGMARGEDPRRVVVSRERKSRGSERTFHEDVTHLDGVREHVVEQIRGLCEGLQRAGELARTVTLKVRYADFRTITRAATLDRPTAAPADVVPVVEGLLGRTDAGRTPIRLVGVTFSNFASEDAPVLEQLALPFAPAW